MALIKVSFAHLNITKISSAYITKEIECGQLSATNLYTDAALATKEATVNKRN